MVQSQASEPQVRFSEDVVSLGDLKTNPGRVVQQSGRTGRPVLLTSHGRGVAVLQSLEAFESGQEQIAFMRAVVDGLSDAEAGRLSSLETVKARLGIA